jgi:hypothetical protein
MKKLIIIAAFAVAVSLPASFGTGRIEISTRPIYDQQREQQQRDQQWMQSQQNQRMQQQQREHWQREQWQREQERRKHRHERWQSYEFWLRYHQYDYDSRR